MEGISQQVASVDGEGYNESPVNTPYNTRAGSPIHGLSSTHRQAEDHDAMNNIWSTWKARHATKTVVSDVDGSAHVPALTKLKYLAIYFAFNLGLTLYNKAVMIQVWPCFIFFFFFFFFEISAVSTF